MARQKNNVVMQNTRGMFGGQVVFKKRAGKGYVAAPSMLMRTGNQHQTSCGHRKDLHAVLNILSGPIPFLN